MQHEKPAQCAGFFVGMTAPVTKLGSGCSFEATRNIGNFRRLLVCALDGFLKLRIRLSTTPRSESFHIMW